MNNSSIKKYAVAGVLIVAIVAYFIFNSKNQTPATVSTQVTTGDNGTSSGSNSGGADNSAGTSGATTSVSGTATGSNGQYKDGTYTGTVADAFYGNLQVKVTVSGGAITDVSAPVYPSANRESQEVNGMALPVLKAEALTAQSAQVNIVSGATQTSGAYQQSLASALSQAKS